MHGTACVYAQPLRSGTSQEGTGRIALLLPSGEGANGPEGAESAGAQHPVVKVEACALNGLHMMIEENSGWSEKGSCVSSSSSDENNVGNGALFVIGLHGSGDTIAHFLQDWKVAKVALSCHAALDMLCQELHDVERRRGCFGF